MKPVEMKVAASQGCQTWSMECPWKACKLPLLKILLGFLKFCPGAVITKLLLLPPVKSQCRDLFSLFPQKMLTFQQELENPTVLLQKSSRNTAGKQELGCLPPPGLALRVSLRYGTGVSEQLALLSRSLVFQQETCIFFFFPYRRQTPASAWPGGLMDMTTLPALIPESPFQVCSGGHLLTNEKHAGDGRCLHEGLDAF